MAPFKLKVLLRKRENCDKQLENLCSVTLQVHTNNSLKWLPLTSQRGICVRVRVRVHVRVHVHVHAL